MIFYVFYLQINVFNIYDVRIVVIACDALHSFWTAAFARPNIMTLYGTARRPVCDCSSLCGCGTVQVWAGAGAVQLPVAGSSRLFSVAWRRRGQVTAVHRPSYSQWWAGRRARTAAPRTCQQPPTAPAARRPALTQLVVMATWRRRRREFPGITRLDRDDVTCLGVSSSLRHGRRQQQQQQHHVPSSLCCWCTLSRWWQTVCRV